MNVIAAVISVCFDVFHVCKDEDERLMMIEVKISGVMNDEAVKVKE